MGGEIIVDVSTRTENRTFRFKVRSCGVGALRFAQTPFVRIETSIITLKATDSLTIGAIALIF
jgi:hypothetical protein